MKKHFTWDRWDFDCDGAAYVIAKSECPNKEDVPNFICINNLINPKCKPEMVVEEGWCKYQWRTDWDNGDGSPRGGYVVEKRKEAPKDSNGKKKIGWFPIWIVRCNAW